MSSILDWILLRLIRAWRRKDRARYLHRQRIVRFDGSFLFWRHELLWPDEWISGNGQRYNRPPWWRPFNAFLHKWCPTDDTGEGMHDHPRWSITICLRGRMIEHTPWGDKHLKPGSIVLRSRKYIHSFSIPNGYSGKTWTLFIVGRRNHPQNTYVVTSRGAKTAVTTGPSA